MGLSSGFVPHKFQMQRTRAISQNCLAVLPESFDRSHDATTLESSVCDAGVAVHEIRDFCHNLAGVAAWERVSESVRHRADDFCAGMGFAHAWDGSPNTLNRPVEAGERTVFFEIEGKWKYDIGDLGEWRVVGIDNNQEFELTQGYVETLVDDRFMGAKSGLKPERRDFSCLDRSRQIGKANSVSNRERDKAA